MNTRTLEPGEYTIRQKSSGRFMDAHEIAEKDFALVTRPAQNNDTQRWELVPGDHRPTSTIVIRATGPHAAEARSLFTFNLNGPDNFQLERGRGRLDDPPELSAGRPGEQGRRG